MTRGKGLITFVRSHLISKTIKFVTDFIYLGRTFEVLLCEDFERLMVSEKYIVTSKFYK